MSKNIQVVVDCSGSIQLAQWWAETLDWKFEWLDPAVFEKLRADGLCTEADVVRVGDKLSWKSGAAINSGEDSNPRQRMYFQDVPEKKVVKNRMHIDVHVGPENLDETVDRLIARGATQVGKGSQGRHNWITLADPEGNEFCVS